MRNLQNVQVRTSSGFEHICPFPIGYVYMSSISTSPADIYGGTWSAISGGKYMRANSTWGNGGSNTISTNQMPAHTHSMKLGHLSGSTNDGSWPMYVEDTRTTSGHLGLTSWQNSYNVHTSNILSTGGGAGILSNVSKRICLVQNCLAVPREWR